MLSLGASTVSLDWGYRDPLVVTDTTAEACRSATERDYAVTCRGSNYESIDASGFQ